VNVNVCSKCKKFIDKGEPHNRDGSSPNFKRFHLNCKKASGVEVKLAVLTPALKKTTASVEPFSAGSNKLKCGNCGAVFFMGVGSKFTFCPSCHVPWKYIAVPSK